MRKAAVLLTFLLAASSLSRAQQPPGTSAPANPLPVRRVILYKAGVGYFEHRGEVSGSQNVGISFTSGQLDDALKSLTAIDLGGGRVAGIRYNSVAPIAERLRALRLPLGEFTSFQELLLALRGARITVRSGPRVGVTGRLVSLEQKTRVRGEQLEEYALVVVATDGGELRSFELTPALSIALGDVDLRRELEDYLLIVGSSRERDVRRMTVTTEGTGRRQLLVSYISEVPVWKVNYRLVLDSASKTKPVLQAWAIVDNTVGEDWNDVELSLIAGAPQSFVQQISQPLYTRRPVMPLPATALLAPQTHQATLRTGATGVRGRVIDREGNVLPGAEVLLLTPAGEKVAGTTAGPDGSYSLSPVAEGTYQLRATLAGFNAATALLAVTAGSETVQDLRMGLSRPSESITVSAESRDAAQRRSRAPAAGPERTETADGDLSGGVAGGFVGGTPAPPPASAEPAAESQPLGDAFEYRLKQPITVRRNESALVPIARAEVEADKVTLWSPRGGRPVRAVWVTNSSSLTLDGGSFSVIEDGAFAGEGLLEVIKPGERRLLSYAADPGVRVDARSEQQGTRVFRASARQGMLVVQRERRDLRTYTVRNDNDAPRVVVVEHPTREGWRLVSSVEAAENAAGIARFRIPVEAHRTASFTVSESHPDQTSITVADVTEDFLQVLVNGGLPAEAVARALRPVLAKRAEAAETRRQLEGNRREIATIERDQQRLRENLKALSESRGDRGLVDRYTRQMGAQEDRLEALRREAQRIEEQIAALELEAQRLLDGVTLEPSPAR